MKIQLDKEKIGSTIEHHTYDKKNINVKYLDGVIDTMPYSKRNLEIITNRQLEQAKERNDSVDVEKLYCSYRSQVKTSISFITISAIFAVANMYNAITSQVTKDKLVDIILSLFFIHLIRLSVFNLLKIKRKYIPAFEEFEKYDAFLTSQSDFEDSGITINDLDDYSLKEILEKENELNEKGRAKKLV